MLVSFLLRSGLAALLFTASALMAVDDPRVEKLGKADDERVSAILAANQARLSAIFSDDLRYAHSTGAVDTKTSYIDLLVSGRTKYNIFDYEERAFSFPAPGIALMTGKVHINATSATGVTDSILSFLAVWREENSQWRFLAWQSCKMPPPAAAADIHDSLVPVKPNFSPGPEYADSTRIFQGIPGLERAANGRLWALWYAGGPDEPGEGAGNYVVMVTSNDDGKTWSGPRLVIDPPGDVRAYDPTLWHDPQGRLWLFWAQSSHWWDGRSGVWAMVCENSGEESPRWSEPRRLCNGIMMNKPTVLSNGDWLLPVSMWAMAPDKRTRPEHQHKLENESGAQVVISRDQGKTFSVLGKTHAPENIFDEHMVVQRRDNSLWMLIRTKLGIAESVSTDGGKTWTPGAPSKIPHVNSRFFIRRLASGKLLLVRHNPPDMKTRSHLTAYLSDDDGVTWSGGLLLDERKGVSYPDGMQDKDGVIRIIYDFARTAEKQIFMAEFTEADVAQGKASGTTRLQVLVNQATGKAPGKAAAATPAAAKPPVDFPMAQVITDPGPAYADSARSWQGIPGIERTKNGRLWVTWYSGDTGEGDMGNYALAATSSDEGKTWSKPIVIAGSKGTRIGDPLPWIDPRGRLWIFYTQLTKGSEEAGVRDFKGTIAIRTEDPESEKPAWSAPFLVAEGGILFGKPLVRTDGSWLAPFCINGRTPWIEEAKGNDTGVLISKDQGDSWRWQGGTKMPKELWSFAEATLAPRRDGSIWMVMRTTKGLYESASSDEGKTWSDPAAMPDFAGTATRAHMRRLDSGAFLLVYHDSKKPKPGRERLTAWLSDDEGRIWPHQLLLDERERVSYPDAVQAADGRIYLTYDHGRYETGDKEILVSIVSEADIRAGKIVSPGSALKLVANQCSAYGNHADLRKEAQRKTPRPSAPKK